MPGPFVELIWPATLERPYGLYELDGPFTVDQIVAMARSMPPMRPPLATDVGC